MTATGSFSDDVEELLAEFEQRANTETFQLDKDGESKLAEMALRCLRIDSGSSDIRLLVRVFKLLGEDHPSVFTCALNALLSRGLDVIFSLHFICAFSDALFEEQQNLFSVELWDLVARGLAHACSLTRKRALFTLKRFTDTKLESLSSSQATSVCGGWFRHSSCNTTTTCQQWQDYFLILETLEEKQVHLVDQVLSNAQVKHLVAVFHPVWVLLVYRRLFAHQNLIVVRWGLNSFLSCGVGDESGSDLSCEQYAGQLQQMVTSDLLQLLNEGKLYSKDSNASTGQAISDQVVKFLCHILSKVPKEEELVVNSLIQAVCRVSWGPLPLFWMSCVLPRLSCGRVVDEKSVLNVLDLIDHHMVYQEPLLRGAAQHNFLAFLVTKAVPLSKVVMANMLYTFWRTRVYYAATPAWALVGDYVKSLYNANINQLADETIKELICLRSSANITGSMEILTKSVMKCLLPLVVAVSSCSTDQEAEHATSLLDHVYSSVFENNADSNRAYAPNRFNLNPEQSERLRAVFLTSLLDTINTPQKRKGKGFLKYCDYSQPESPSIKAIKQFPNKVLNDEVQEKMFTALRFLLSSQDIQSVKIADIYVRIVSLSRSFSITSVDVLSEFVTCFLGNHSDIATAVSLQIVLKIVNEIQIIFNHSDCRRNLSKMWPEMPLTLSFQQAITNREMQRISGQLSWQFRDDQLNFLKHYISRNLLDDLSEDWQSNLLAYAEESLECGGYECAISAIQLVSLLDRVSPTNFLVLAQRVVFDFRKNEMFWPALEALLSLSFENIVAEFDVVSKIIKDTVMEAKSVPAIMGLLLDALANYVKINTDFSELPESTCELVMSLLVRCATFGPTFRRDQKVVTETNRMISDEGPKLAVNRLEGSDHQLCQRVRVVAINLLVSVISSSEPQCVPSLMASILDAFSGLQVEVSKGRTRHFENSDIHKLRHRMMQAMLVLCKLVGGFHTVDMCHKLELLSWVLNELQQHKDQNSVRYLLEWTATVLASSIQATHRQNNQTNDTESPESEKPKFNTNATNSPESMLWQQLEIASQTKSLGAVPSFITVIVNLACLPNASATLWEQTILEVSPWSMAQQFGLRMVAQMAIEKLWRTGIRHHSHLLPKYQVLYNCISKSLECSDHDKSMKNLKEDFYLAVFDPVSHFTLEDIFQHFPRLCGLLEDEVIPDQLFSLFAVNYTRSVAALSYLSDMMGKEPSSLASCAPTKLTPKNPQTNTTEKSAENIQRKITPWKSMNIETSVEDSQRFSKSKVREYEDLIMIASLVDRLPNLGGLCRTCEIFGVGRMTIPSAAVLKEKDFSGVSVTAEHWIPLEEVTETDLPNYLQSLKRNGYTIVAIEQANQSVPLQTFKFPAKCAILLGKEREGVPVELLNLVDDCVEIPQHGLIRSFNVHVTGAMVLWEYVRQRLLAA